MLRADQFGCKARNWISSFVIWQTENILQILPAKSYSPSSVSQNSAKNLSVSLGLPPPSLCALEHIAPAAAGAEGSRASTNLTRTPLGHPRTDQRNGLRHAVATHVSLSTVD